jgi:hypothetical protein
MSIRIQFVELQPFCLRPYIDCRETFQASHIECQFAALCQLIEVCLRFSRY